MAENRVTGAYADPGRARGRVLLEAGSHAEVNEPLTGCHYRGLVKWNVTALEKSSERAGFDRQRLEEPETGSTPSRVEDG